MRILNNKIVRGFTLIELIVVIAIIGMLSSISLVALKNARNKALDAKVKAQLRNLRTAAELYKSKYGNYGIQVAARDDQVAFPFAAPATIGNGCGVVNSLFTDPQIAPYLQSSNYPSYVSDLYSSNQTTYARCVAIGVDAADPVANRYLVVVKLSTGAYYCIDSVGGPVEAFGNPPLTRFAYASSALYTIDDCVEVLTCGIPL